MFTISSFKSIENKHDVYRGKDCMKKFCESLRGHAMEIINFKKKTNEVINKGAARIISKFKYCKEKFENKHVKDKKYCKVRDRSHYAGEYRGATHSIFNLKYSVPEKIHIAFHNGSNCDYPFIIKKSAEEYNKQFTYLGENTENI